MSQVFRIMKKGSGFKLQKAADGSFCSDKDGIRFDPSTGILTTRKQSLSMKSEGNGGWKGTYKNWDITVHTSATETSVNFDLMEEIEAEPCPSCSGTGMYQDRGHCYRCGGKGFQTKLDRERNRVYDTKYRKLNKERREQVLRSQYI